MATPKSQRIGIWIIAIVLVLGTLGSFLAMILGTQNQEIDTANLKKVQTEYQAEVAKRDEQVAIQTKQLSDKYYPEFSVYASSPAAFNADDIKEVTKTDIKVGDGEEIKTGTEYNAYYIGWNPKGVIFDQSIVNGALAAPIVGGKLILGWEEGVKGMKIGGVREISIPSDKAYGKEGSGDNIPADTPLKFIVMAIPKVPVIKEVTVPQILIDNYQSQQQQYQQ